MALNIIQGNITELDVEAIVNAANSSLLGGGGVDGAIHRAAGPELLEECRKLNGCKAGNAKITRGYKLKAKYIIHTVGPVWQGGQNNEASTLKNCYLNSLTLAVENDIKSIAFPAISCGVYSYPIEKAARIAISTCKEFQSTHPDLKISLCVFSEGDLKIYNELNSQKDFLCDLAISERILGSLFGFAIGDALGVPVKFITRNQLSDSPVKGMLGHGTHNQPPGTWSDDTSMTLCTILSLMENEFSPTDIMKRFSKWSEKGFMAAHGEAFDIGNATSESIARFKAGTPSTEWGCKSDWQNGNGSLMRILPLSLYTLSEIESSALEKSFQCSALTHAHIRAKLVCGYFTLLIRKLINGRSLEEAMDYANEEINAYVPDKEKAHLGSLLDKSILNKDLKDISSSGYVIHTMEASLYCITTSSSYEEAILKAVNLGDDTDTTACITGAIAGIIFGKENIPVKWIEHLSEADMLSEHFNKFTEFICNRKKL